MKKPQVWCDVGQMDVPMQKHVRQIAAKQTEVVQRMASSRESENILHTNFHQSQYVPKTVRRCVSHETLW